ncbi:family 10 glycosylhydrolase [Pseudenhygromyxa sp. WMMC2535]|uniref:glycoside hydrolase family 10 protein n=1 Tax=Pseudenhygromyxa sp. WMMC2535 TaxID=2712867 RepID=UPI0015560994|nr:family 10 glycosylhydrolase [Pseudenhygromyxa sp. WMMC2535]NVB36726.1 family 10 glycosylhydrolase [Pseudenhygromyxa sp. WMMC2535]
MIRRIQGLSLARTFSTSALAGALGLALVGCSGGTGYEDGGLETGTGESEGQDELDTLDESSTGVDAGDSAETTGGESETETEDTSEVWDQELVDVAHAREFRGVWVTTVYNINWPSSAGLGQVAAQAELIEIVEAAAAINLNAIVFQIRPESDAVYASSLEPWSRYLTGSQGSDPGWDPLTFLIEQAHVRNLEVHGWLNPYRAAAGASSALSEPHIALQLPEHAHVYGSALWMDPGSVDVREHVVDVVADVVERYEIDGIHLDDYFYPYPTDEDFPDELTWSAYVQDGGQLARDDWRRENVNALVEELHDTIALTDPDVRFGIAPFGIYRSGIPEGIVGLDQYASLYADPLLWMEEGWLDYAAPQLYWPTYSQQQNYELLLDWWSTLNPDRYVFVGNYLSNIGEWGLDEILAQLALSRAYADQNSLGNILFQVQPLLADTMGVNAALAEQFYGQPALTPPLAERLDAEVDPPLVTVQGAGALVEDLSAQRLRAWVVYADQGGEWVLDRIVPVPSGEDSALIDLDAGRWAISAAGWHNVESPGVVIEL